jgi:hypothetical protein
MAWLPAEGRGEPGVHLLSYSQSPTYSMREKKLVFVTYFVNKYAKTVQNEVGHHNNNISVQ